MRSNDFKETVLDNNRGEREFSIDLLKIISMIMVLGLHTNRYGGFLDVNNPCWYKFLIYFYEHLQIVAVDVFVIISAWFLSTKTEISFKKIFSMLVAIVFWTVISLIVAYSLGIPVGIMDLAKSIPFFGRAYDFMSGYLVMYMFAPYLNKMIKACTKQQLICLGFGVFIIFSLCSPITSSHYLKIGGGYSCFWFICLYLITVALKVCTYKVRKLPLLVTYLLLALIASFAEYKGLPIIGDLSYNNFLVTICAFSIFLFFKEIRLSNKILINFVTYFSPLTLGVFLIHDHNLMEYYYTTLSIASYIEDYPYIYIIAFPVFIFIAFVLFALLEKNRIVLFDKIGFTKRINKFAVTVVNQVNACIQKND